MSRTTDISGRLRFAIFAIAITVTTAAVALVDSGSSPGQWALAAVLAAAALGLEFGQSRFWRGIPVSIADIPLMASVLLLDPGLAMLAGGVAMAIPSGRAGAVSRVVNGLTAAIPAGIAAGLFAVMQSALGIQHPRDGVWLWFACGVLAVSTYPPVHYLAHGIWTWRAFGVPFRQWMGEGVLPVLRADPVSVVLVVSLVEIGLLLGDYAAGLPIVLAVAGGVGMWMWLRTTQRQVEARQLKDEFFRAIFVSLARLLEMKDPETAQHSARVALFSRDIAAVMGLSEEDQSRIHLAGLLHDVGKVGVPDEILLKPGRFNEYERRIMERHPRLSAEAIAGIPGFSDLTRMVYAHHERVDGSGYPEGLSGQGVPLGARILGVADTYEALTADRPYRKGRPPEVALQIFEDEMHLFDREIVDALRYLVLSGATKYKAETLADFSEEWAKAAKFLDVRLDEEPFEVPPETRRPDAVPEPRLQDAEDPIPMRRESDMPMRRESDVYGAVSMAGQSEAG